MNVPDPMTCDEMRDRYQQLQALRDRIDQQMDALAAGLRMHGEWKGAPRKPAVMSSAEAKRAHAAYATGDRSIWAREGERQYQRDNKRRNYYRRQRENGAAA